MKINTKLFWIFALSSAVYFTQGVEGLPGLALFFFLKEKLGFSAEKIMYISSITGLAWLIKPLWGYLADNYLTKKTWILISLLGSILIASYFGLSPILPLGMLILMASLGGWTAAMRDTSVDGIMCVSGKEHNECGRIQALQWASITVASIIVGLAGGYIADHFSYKFGYLCLIPIYIIIGTIVLKYRTCVQLNEQKSKFLDTVKSYKILFTHKKFLWACLFLFLYKYSPSFGTPLAFIERDIFKWSGMWMGTLGAIISGFEILGALIYFRIGKRINLKRWLIASVFLGATTTLCYLWFTPVTAVVYGVLFAVLGMLIHLIIMAWMAESTIAGKEATSFALLCSVSNLAATASSLSGAFLYPKIGLQWLICISALTSFVCLPLISKLGLTNGRTDEKR